MEVMRWRKGEDERCEFVLTNGQQCGNKAVPGVTRCPLHGANTQLASIEKKSIRMYRLAKFQTRVNELADHDKLKTLKEEVALLRMMVEEKVNRCEDSTELMLVSGPVTEMIMKVQKLVESCSRLEMKSGSLLDKQRVHNLATTLMNIVAIKINEFAENNLGTEGTENLLEAIANSFLEVLKDA
jgi:hypothetical protein